MSLNTQLTILATIYISLLFAVNDIYGEPTITPEDYKSTYNVDNVFSSDSTILQVIYEGEYIYCTKLFKRDNMIYFYRNDGTKGFIFQSNDEFSKILVKEIPCGKDCIYK